MKISSDPGMVSALETWLRDTPDAEELAHGSSGLVQVSAGSEPALQLSNSGATAPRDSAEGLLELDVWKGMPDGSRQLSPSALFQPHAAEASRIIQGWAEHIFQPLV